MGRIKFLTMRAKASPISTQGKQIMLKPEGAVITGEARQSLSRGYDPVKEKAEAITPVPGGLGPMTVTMLLFNTVTAAERQAGD